MNNWPVIANILMDEPDIHHIFFESLSTIDALAIYQYCSSFQSQASNALANRLSLPNLIADFFPMPMERLMFAQLQRKVDIYISGSQALQFFLGVQWQNSDLDLFCWPGTEALAVTILGRLDYRRDETAAAPYYNNARKIKTVISLVRIHGGRCKSIQLIVAENSPVETILQFHSTAVMNFITWEYAICLFPHYTLHMKDSIVCHEDSDALAKYDQRGFSIVRGLYPTFIQKEITPGDRRVGDRHCLVIRVRDKDPLTNEALLSSVDHSNDAPNIAYTLISEPVPSFVILDPRLGDPDEPHNVFLNSWTVSAPFDGSSLRYTGVSMKSHLVLHADKRTTYTCGQDVLDTLKALDLIDDKISVATFKKVVRNLAGW